MLMFRKLNESSWTQLEENLDSFLDNTEEVKGYKTLDGKTGQVSYTQVAKFDEQSVMEKSTIEKVRTQQTIQQHLNPEDAKQTSFTSLHENDCLKLQVDKQSRPPHN